MDCLSLIKFRYGNGVVIVVRDREILLHGKGRQQNNQNDERLWWNTMIRPESILDILSKKPKNYCFSDLYKLLYNKDLYELGYKNISNFIGIDPKKNIRKKFQDINIDDIVNDIRSEKYKPNNIPHVDKLIQSVLGLILLSIFNIKGESASKILWNIKSTGTGTKWWIKYSIEKSISKDVILNILENKISDRRFLNLIRKFLNEDLFNFDDNLTYSGTPVYSILNSCLYQIVSSQLNNKLLEISNNFNSGKARNLNPEYVKLDTKVRRLRRNYFKSKDINILKELKFAKRARNKITSVDEFDPDYKRMKSFIYMNDGLISVIGSKKIATQVIKHILEISNQLGINVNVNLFNASDNKLIYLNTQIVYNKNGNFSKMGNRQSKGNIVLSLPYHVIIKQINDDRLGYWKGKRFITKHKMELVNDTDLEIFLHYTTKLERLYNYYKICGNVSKLDNLSNLYLISMVMTLALKYKTSASKIHEKFKIFGNKIGLKYQYKKTEKIIVFKTNEYVYVPKCVSHPFVDLKLLRLNFSVFTTNLDDRLNAEKCSICGSEENLHIHHIRFLNDISHKKWKNRKISERSRKTIVVCQQCHNKIHKG